MKTSTIPQDITLAVCSLSTSFLIYASLEAQAAPPEDEPIPWYRGNIPMMSIIAPGPNPAQNRLAHWQLTATRLTEGNLVASSIVGSYPIGIGENWVIEPQAQLISVRTLADNPNTSPNTNLARPDEQSAWSGRVGARLTGNYQVGDLPVEPYLRTNLWHSYSNSGPLSLGQVDKISSSRYSTSVEVGLGLLARVTPNVSLFVSGDYSGSTDNAFGLIGNVGVRVRW